MSALTSETAPPPQRGELDRRTATQHALFGLLPLLFSAFVAYYVFSGPNAAVDFRQEYWVAGWRILHGGSLYHWTSAQINQGVAFPYPALAALVFVPFSLIPVGASLVLFTVVCALSAWGALGALGVRDWRVYGVVLTWGPVVAAWQTGNLTLLLCLGIALVWRYRSRPVVVGLLTALLISLKTFMWPLALWLLVTRRYRAFAQMAIAALALNAVAWAVVGPAEVHGFLTLSSRVTATLYRNGYGVPAFVAGVGLAPMAGTVIEVSLSLTAALFCWRFGRRHDDLRALTFTLVLMLLASPLVWPHYLALLIVPLAIARPRISWAWALPIVLLACPADGVALVQVVLLWLVAAACLADTLGIWERAIAYTRHRETPFPAPSGP